MKKFILTIMPPKSKFLCLLWFSMAMGCGAFAQQSTTVLPNNASYSNKTSPEGGLRFQRGFYLIKPDEARRSGLASGMVLNSIGFNIARAQSDTSRGQFKLYLQNTPDSVSRSDTNWTTMSNVFSDSYQANNLFPGKYEWQVKYNCPSNSGYTTSTFFTNDQLDGCNNPYNLMADSIGFSSAKLCWESSSSPDFQQYYLEYTSVDSIHWISAYTKKKYYRLTGLDTGKYYQWRVRTICSTDSSSVNSSSFSTDNYSPCSAISGHAYSVKTDTTVVLRWTPATTAIYYEIRFKRKSTRSWSTASSYSDSVKLKLDRGTTYQWEVRNVCDSASRGGFSAGPNFTTSGETECYLPLDPTTRNITNSSAKLTWTRVENDSLGYTLRYRLKNSITWPQAIAGMTLASDSILTVPKTSGPYDIPFKQGSPFTYGGNGIYVAWEYTRPTGIYTSFNLTLSTDQGTAIKNAGGQDSITYLLSMVSRADTSQTAPADRLGENRLRPETRFGSPSLSDSAAVIAIYSLGTTSSSFQSPTEISAVVENKMNSIKDFAITLTIKEKDSGVVRYMITETVPVKPNDTSIVVFNGWIPSVNETDSIIVSIAPHPGENILNNNRAAIVQKVNKTYIGYDDGSAAITDAGFGTGSGLLLNKYKITGCGKVLSAKVYLAPPAEGHPLKAVVRNVAGNIVAESELFTPGAGDINNYHSFYFINPPAFSSESFFIGILQTASATSYNPVGVQLEIPFSRTGSYYRANADGSNLIDSPAQGRLMILAELASSSPEVFIEGDKILCTGGSNTLSLGSTSSRFANKVLAFSSQYHSSGYSAAQVLGTPNAFPAYGFSPLSWTSATPDGRREFLTLTFPDPAPINFVDIYETGNPGAVDSIFVKDTLNNYILVYSATAAAAPAVARRNRIEFPMTGYNVSEIRIAINSPAVAGYNIIDAVSIGKKLSNATFTQVLWTPGGETTSTKIVNTAGEYSVQVSDGSGCSSKSSFTVKAAATVKPVITANKSAAICQGDSITLTSDQATGNTWSPGGATTQSITVKAAGSYTVSYDDGGGCSILVSDPFVVSINPLPTASISGSTELCRGNANTLDAGPGFSAYAWNTSDTTQTIQVRSEGAYLVKVTDANGCSDTASMITNYVTLAPPTITGDLIFCSGSSTILDAGAGYASYFWSTGETSRTITVDTEGDFSVAVTNTNGCSSSNTVTTTYAVLAPPVITGNLIFCPGDSSLLDAGAGYASYLWSNGKTTRTILVKTIGDFEVRVTNSQGCSSVSQVTTDLYPAPIPQITGNSGFCKGSSTLITATAGFVQYLWSTGAQTQSISASVANNYKVTVTDALGCKGSAFKLITAFPSPKPVISGTLSFCGGTSTTLNAGSGYQSYLWSNGQTMQNITVTTIGSFHVTVTDNNGCTGSDTVVTNNTGTLPSTPGPISGNTSTSCGANGLVYSITAVPNTSHYVWTVPTGANIVSGQGTTSITVNFGPAFQGGKIVVAASNACGQSETLNSRSLEVTSLPAKADKITGPIADVCGPVTKTYSILPTALASSYNWTAPAGATVISGQGTTSVNISFPAGFTSGNLCVTSSNNCGTSMPVCTIVSGLLAAPGTINGATSMCKKASSVFYSIAPVYNATSYTWTVPNKATITAGQGTRSILVDMDNYSGDITVKANGACGSSSVSTLAITINNCNARQYTYNELRPVPEVISAYGGSIKTSGLFFEYTLGETEVETMKKPGLVYSQGFHQPLVYFMKAKEKDTVLLLSTDMIRIKAYPNPVSSVLKVKVEMPANIGLGIDLMDIFGHVLQRQDIKPGLNYNTMEFNLSRYPGGNYYLIVKERNGKIINTIKLIKAE